MPAAHNAHDAHRSRGAQCRFPLSAASGLLHRELLVAAALLCGVGLVRAGERNVREPIVAAPGSSDQRKSAAAVHAAFTLNLIRFIDWPGEAMGPPDAPFLIGTFADDPINPELERLLRGESVAGHPVKTMRIQSQADVARCKVVFFSRGTADPRQLLGSVGRLPILTVSNTERFLALGGHVEFAVDSPFSRFQVSAENLRASGLRARSQLLRISARP